MKSSSKRLKRQEIQEVKSHKCFKRNKESERQLNFGRAKFLNPPGSLKLKTGGDNSSINDEQGYDNYSDQSFSDLKRPESFSPYNTLLISLQDSRKHPKLGSRREINKDNVANKSVYTQSSPAIFSQNNDAKSDFSEDDVDSEKNDIGTEDALLSSDPYNWHFVSEFPHVASKLAAAKSDSWVSIQPSGENDPCVRVVVPKITNAEGTFRGHYSLPDNLWLKHRLFKNYEETKAPLDVLQSELSKYLLRYHDILYGRRSPSTANSLRFINCLHALNHVYKTRDRILKNSEKRAHMESGQDIELRDQGFTRPKVLFLLETRQNCFKYASVLSSLAKPEQEEHKKRFNDNFYLPENKFSMNDSEDFRELFEGNDDNNFRLGLKLTRKTIKYFANFYSADIILASPLGLRSAIEANE